MLQLLPIILAQWEAGDTIAVFAIAVGAVVTLYATKRVVDATLGPQARMTHLTAFLEFTRRYREQSHAHPIEKTFRAAAGGWSALSRTQQEELVVALRGYMDLYSEEFWCFKLHLLHRRTWAVWKRGLKALIAQDYFGPAWEVIKSEYYGEFVGMIASTTALK